ncbi:MAG: NADH-quinone oxidoreductase subunit M [Pseudomonadota bacterium]
MLSVTIFLPLATALLVLVIPAAHTGLIRGAGIAGAAATLAASLLLWSGYDSADPALQWRQRVVWVDALNAHYDVGVDGLSLPLIVLTALLLTLTLIYVAGRRERAKMQVFLFLLMGTGLLGVFAAQDLLLFYLFFEVALVPMYFIIGIWGHEGRRYAALKFFLYTRLASLAMLLSFLALYLAMEPHSFSLPEIARAQPYAAATPGAGLVLLGLVIGFGVKLPIVPLHNWLPDAHVEAPTEGSIMLAAVQLKMGGYGLLRVALEALPEVVQRHAVALLWLGAVGVIYGALAALAQRDLKRLIAYTSVSHMGFVTLGFAAAALAGSESLRRFALTGASFQMVSHGLLTGAMFLMVGLLEARAGTREIARFGGLLGRLPRWSALFAVLAFGSLGLPGMSGFVGEFQVLGATLATSLGAALLVLIGLAVTTGLYLHLLSRIVLGGAPASMPALAEPPRVGLGIAMVLAVLAIALGLVPALLTGVIAGGVSGI